MNDEKKSNSELIEEIKQLRSELDSLKNGGIDFNDSNLLDSIMELSEDAIFIADPKTGQLLGANKSAQKLVGWSLAELKTMHQSQLHPPERKEEYRGKFDKATTFKGPVNVEVEVIHKDGTVFPVKIISGGIIRSRGRDIHLGIFKKITEKDRVRQALEDTEQRYRLVAENASDNIWILRLSDMRFTYISPSCEKLFGYTPKESMDMPIDEHIPSEYLEKVTRILAEELERDKNPEVNPERSKIIEVEQYTKLGGLIWTEIKASFLRDDAGNVHSVLGITRDISDRKKAEQALQKERDRAQMYLDLAGVMFIALDDQGRVIMANQKASEVLQATEMEIIGKDWFDNFIHEEQRAEVRSVYQKLMSGETISVKFYTNDVVTLKGDRRIISWHNSILMNDSGNATGVISAGEDITDQKIAEQKEASLKEQLAQSQKMEAIGRLAGGLAHDFNNLLTAILGFADLLDEGLENDSPLKNDVRQIQDASQSAADLTGQLLAFSRKQIVTPRILNLNKAIKRSEKMIRRLIREDIHLTCKPDADLWKVNIDPNQIDQILLNIAVNARDAMPDGGNLTIRAYNETYIEEKCRSCADFMTGEYVVIVVADTGIGMDPETQEQIFEPFFTTKVKGVGTGLGLSTIHGIVHQNQGHINVTSTPGQGAQFTVYLPRIEGEATDEEAVQKFAQLTGDEIILLVEDQQVVRTLVKKSLVTHGYTVIEAENGPDALSLYERKKDEIDLLLTDVIMPKMSGKQLYDLLYEINPKLDVLYMSGYTEDTIADHGVLEEGTRFIQKPFRPVDLLKKLREVLDTDSHN